MAAFQFYLNKQLRKLGLEGNLAWAMTHEGALQLQDDTQHTVRIAPAEISRIRIGYFDAKSRSYHMRIWRDGTQKPIELVPARATWTGYRDASYELGELLARANLLDRIETGSSKFDALFGPMLMLIPTLGALVLAVFVLTEEPWWGRMIVPIVPTIVFALLGWVGAKRYWPRPLRYVTDLEKQLPPA